VPPARVSLIGRERESARLGELLRAAGVVTLCGPGGVGKTTLATWMADHLDEEVCWCDLVPVSSDDGVAVQVAAALGGRTVAIEEAERELPGLVAGRRLVVVLDNCEHVRAGAAAAAAALIAPDVHVLATSRESLGVTGEHVFTLSPLEEGAAVRLFAERAAAVRTGFSLSDENAGDVARLCRRVDGLPLAVELAAARARSLSPREIADRLDERFALLAAPKRAPDRHRSLRAAIDWSYELLNGDEQELFARLGVFSTPVTFGEIEQVCGGDDVLDRLDALVDRSLVTVHEAPDGTRYGMLESLRAYARERLAERGEVEVMHDRHADRYVAVADELRLESLTRWTAAGLVRMSDMADALMALRWCVERDDDASRAFEMMAPLWAVVHSTAAAEVTDLAERALARWGRGDPRAVRVLGVAATGHFVLGQPELARARALEGIGAADAASGLIARRALALVVYHYERELEESDRLLGEVIGLAEHRGATWIAIEMSVLRALVLAAGGAAEAGLALARSTRESAQSAGGTHLDAWITHVLGMIELGWGSVDAARGELERALELARALDYPLIVGGSLRYLGVIAALAGDRAGAAQAVGGAVEHFRVKGDRVQRWEALRSAAVVLAAAGDREVALRLLAGAQASPVARGLAPLERALLARVMPDAVDDLPARHGDDLETLTKVAFAALGSAPPAATAVPTASAPPAATAVPTASAPPAATAVPASTSPPAAVFRREGSLWRFEFAGTEVQMPHRKGFADLAALLANPGQEIHCLDLHGDGARAGDLGEVVDARGREEYRARAHELQAEIEDARRANDPARVERARDELAEIAEALEAAYGLGGRVRRAGDPAERARTAVAWRIRSALGKLEPEHGPLARHLRNAVRTGTWCVYDPETPVNWQL
jgi:predicted ATPase